MSETTPKEQRGPTNLRIKFRSASIEQFIERYAADVSRGGIFIRTREPLSVGTQLRLELQLQDGTALLAGEGTVIWIRESDPARANVPPGMAVRFDKVTDQTQPTLDRILAERARMEEAGHLPAQQTGGMAVRRPSGVLSSLDASSRVSAPASSAPTAPVAAEGASNDAGRTGTSPATKTSFLASRMTPGAGSSTPATAGPFTRARQTGTRPVPVPSALFEPPTAADIDKALSALEEAPGAAPLPSMPSVPRFVGEDISNDPTRVGDSAAAALIDEAARAAAPDLAESSSGADEPKLPASLAEAAAPVAGQADNAAVSVPADKAAVTAPAAPDVSRRFRAASRAYPTLNRRRGTGLVVGLIVLGAAGAVVWKLRPGSPVPTTAVSVPAATVTPAPAPSAPPPAPEAVPPPSTPPSEAALPPAAEAAPPAAAKPAAEKPAAAERSSPHHAARRKGHEEASSAHAAGNQAAAADKPADTKPADQAPAADKPAPEKETAAPADKPAEAKPAAAVLKITSTPAGAEVSIDGNTVGNTPFSSKDIDPGAPHAITLKKDGFETHERMIGASDWSRPHGSAPPALKVNVKLRRIAPPPAETPKDTNPPAEDTGGPYIKEVNPSNP